MKGTLLIMLVEIEPGRVRITLDHRSTVVRGKAVALVCLLIAEQGRLITDDEVHTLPGWSGMARDSVGKQVARIVDGLENKGLRLVVWRNKTNGWQLAPAVTASLGSETRNVALDWLNGHGWGQTGRFSAVPPSDIAQWALAAGTAALAITEGRTADGLQSLRQAYAAADHPDLKAIADVLATRIGQRLSPAHLPVPGVHGTRTVFEIALEARRIAAYAIQSDSSKWATQVTELLALLPELMAAGSLTTQAYVHNALALLYRRLGEHQNALSHAAEAAPLAVFSGDLTLMQAVFFNFGNIASELRRLHIGSIPEGLSISLIEADRTIRNRFGLGMDSAQAELLLAYLAYEEGALEKAEAYLKDARTIIAISHMPADKALETRISGLIQLSRGDRSGLAALEGALIMFEAIGNAAAVAHVRGEIEANAERT